LNELYPILLPRDPPGRCLVDFAAMFCTISAVFGSRSQRDGAAVDFASGKQDKAAASGFLNQQLLIIFVGQTVMKRYGAK
jgi:hypothetical protein